MYGLLRPRRTIFGMDFAGVVEALGAEVTSFRPGDRVFGMCPPRSNGAQAEYVCIPESGPIAVMPKDTRLRRSGGLRGRLLRQLGADKIPPRAGPQNLDLRRLRRHRLGGGAARESLRRRGDGGRRHATSGAGQIPRRGPRHRLHRRGFHPHRRALRFRLRRGREAQFLSMPQTAEIQAGRLWRQTSALGGRIYR